MTSTWNKAALCAFLLLIFSLALFSIMPPEGDWVYEMSDWHLWWVTFGKTLLAGFSSAAALYLAVHAIKETEVSPMKGRWLAIITSALSAILLLLIILVFVIELL